MSAVARIKVTVAPPPVCGACWWRTRYQELAGQNKGLRLELMRSRSSAKDEPREDVPDVVDHFRRTAGREE